MTSAAQDQWAEVCSALRARVARMVERTKAAEPDDVLSLVAAVSESMDLEIRAATYDATVEARAAVMQRKAAQ